MSELRHLSSCGCCGGTAVVTPEGITNRSGLSAIAYRIGTHPEFKASLLARLSGAGLGALQGLRTRDESDFSIALLDAFSTVADVLTFYQERIANESYLRTATERRSILELARLIGYELDPGVAATVYLAFTIEDAPGGFGRALSVASTMPTAPEEAPPVTIPVGTKVQTVPGPDELPQTFETIEEIEGRGIWNAMKARSLAPQTLSVTMPRVYLAGTSTNLRKGDRLLIAAGGGTKMRTVVEVTRDSEKKHTLVLLDTETAASATAVAAAAVTTTGGSLGGGFSSIAVNQIVTGVYTEEELQFASITNQWDRNAISVSVNTAPPPQPPAGDGVYVFREHAAVFGFNAPMVDAKDPLHGADPVGDKKIDDGEPASTGLRKIHLDRVYGEVLPNSWVVFENPDGAQRILQVHDVREVSRSVFYISGRCTRIVVDSEPLTDYKIRATTALVQSEKLDLALAPIDTDVEGIEVELDADYPWLKKGRTVAITGTLSDLTAVTKSEIRTLDAITLAQGYTRLRFDRALDESYERTSVVVNANVAFATHGETTVEILGSGDATQTFQRFKLKRPPLTYVGADNDTGSVSTLEVRVNDVRWKEVTDFYGHEPEERIYTIRLDDDANAFVMFGDGKSGARLPTGTNNVIATYRHGIGLSGNARAGQISQMMNKPSGVKGATNPLEAGGAGDPEVLAGARSNASLTALTLGRVVSLRDYEDFARAFTGVAKASATWSWTGEQRQILLTLAGDGAKAVDPTDDLALRLGSAIHKLGDEHVALTLASYDPLWFTVRARVKVDPDYLTEKVFAEIRALLLSEFSFDARSFGQAVSRAEVIAVIHEVKGVIAVDIDQFYSNEGSASDDVARIGALPRTKNGPARLLTINPASEPQLEVMA